MANVQGVLSAHITDKYGIVGTMPVFIIMDDTKTIAQLVTDALSFKTDVQALSDGVVTKVTVSVIAFENTNLTGVAGDIEKGGLFNFNNATDPYVQGYTVPDIAAGVLNASGLIDLTNANVTAFVAFMTTAHTVITVVTKGVRALTSLKDALINFRKHRKPLSRKTTERG